MRVAPGGDAGEHLAALTRHLERHAPWGAQVTVTPGDVGQPYAIDASGAGLRRRPRGVPAGMGRRTRRHRSRWLDSVHRRVRRGVPVGEDPRDRRGRPCDASTQRQREPAPGSAGTRRHRRSAAAGGPGRPFRRTGLGGAWRHGRWRECCTAPPRSCPSRRRRTSNGSHPERSCRTSSFRRMRPTQ